MRSNILKPLITLNHQSLNFKTIRTSNTPFAYWNNQLKPLNEYSKLSIFQLCFMQNLCPVVPIMPTASAKLCLVVTGEKGDLASQPASKQSWRPVGQVKGGVWGGGSLPGKENSSYVFGVGALLGCQSFLVLHLQC